MLRIRRLLPGKVRSASCGPRHGPGAASLAAGDPLAGVSAAQLASGLAGLAVAVGRRRHYDLRQVFGDRPLAHGSPEHVARDALWSGTAYSAPGPMLVAQLSAITRLAAPPDERARRLLAWLGASMVPGYLAERYTRGRLSPGGWDPVETPVVAAGLGLAAAMAVLGRRAQGEPSP